MRGLFSILVALNGGLTSSMALTVFRVTVVYCTVDTVKERWITKTKK